ncbi:MAG: aldose epimerase family protein [Sphaerochaeta sp.]|jgi:aldose 1-epimerase|nr:galactose mutarotase [Spirochaetales bacterium]
MIDTKHVGKTAQGDDILLVTLANNGMVARILSLGAILQSVEVPDREGQRRDVVLGFENPLDYVGSTTYFGQVVGRYANRIRGAHFTLEGVGHNLEANEGANTLHSGSSNWGWHNWCAETFMLGDDPGVVLSYYSPAEQGGFPSAVNCTVTYLLKADGSLVIDYEATADGPTPINLTNHSYFNLAGAASGTILEHELQLHCDRYLPVDNELLPTGELIAVQNTPFDFTTSKLIGRDIEAAGGYDHCFVFSDESEELKHVATVREQKSGRTLDVHTTLPAVQFYSGNFLDGSVNGKGGAAYPQHGGFCLETQFYPDSPNQQHFPSTIFSKERPYKHTTVFKFSAKG